MIDPVRLPSGIVVDRSEIEQFILLTNRMYPTFEPVKLEDMADLVTPVPELQAVLRSLFSTVFFFHPLCLFLINRIYRPAPRAPS